jgi:hypothetical protein
VGHDTPVRVIEVGEQTELNSLTLGQYATYLEEVSKAPDNTRKILNMISLEFSNTQLSDLVSPPKFVDALDWVQLYWPIEMIARGDFPRVQKYCLAGMAGSYTDFHIDFGGTSVWYHVLWGKKRFYLIPPTAENLQIYEDWTCSQNQGKIFLGDRVPRECFYIDIVPGETFIIPSGWIHAVYTPDDSLVFGGNFLHSYAITRQLQCFKIESRTKVNEVYMFPYFRQIHFCALLHFYDAILKQRCLDSISCDILHQIPLLLRTCEIWKKDRTFRLTFESLVDFDLNLLLDELWEYVENSDFPVWLGSGWSDKDMKNTDSWETQISLKIQSESFSKLITEASSLSLLNSFTTKRKKPSADIEQLLRITVHDPESSESEYEESSESKSLPKVIRKKQKLLSHDSQKEKAKVKKTPIGSANRAKILKLCGIRKK